MFVSDFQTTAIMSIVKTYAEHFMSTTPLLNELFLEYLRKDSYA